MGRGKALTSERRIRAAAAARGLLEPALLERPQHHERRGERRAGERIVQHVVLSGQRQDFVEPAAGVPQCIDEQPFSEIGYL